MNREPKKTREPKNVILHSRKFFLDLTRQLLISCFFRRIAADQARIVSVMHPFDASEYVTMDEIEEMEQTIKNTQAEESSVKDKDLR